MRIRFIVALLSLALLAVVSAPAFAQTEELTPDQQYLKMLEQSASMPLEFDFKALREIYPKTTFFNPYGTFYKKDVHALFAIYKSEKSPENAAKIAEYLKLNFPLPEVHTRYIGNYNGMDMTGPLPFHIWANKGLMEALMESGNGTDAKNAFKVLNISEETLIAEKFMGGQPTKELKTVDGRVYDVVSGLNTKTGKHINVWFDVTDILAKNPANKVEPKVEPSAVP